MTVTAIAKATNIQPTVSICAVYLGSLVSCRSVIRDLHPHRHPPKVSTKAFQNKIKSRCKMLISSIYWNGMCDAAKSALRSGLRGDERSRMAEPEVEAAWRAEFERSGVKELRDALSGNGFTDELERQVALRWLGDEVEARRLREEKTYHYVRGTLLMVVAGVIAGLIAVDLEQLR